MQPFYIQVNENKWISLDMHTETIPVILLNAGGKKKGRPIFQCIDNIKKWSRASLQENRTVTENMTALC